MIYSSSQIEAIRFITKLDVFLAEAATKLACLKHSVPSHVQKEALNDAKTVAFRGITSRIQHFLRIGVDADIALIRITITHGNDLVLNDRSARVPDCKETAELLMRAGIHAFKLHDEALDEKQFWS